MRLTARRTLAAMTALTLTVSLGAVACFGPAKSGTGASATASGSASPAPIVPADCASLTIDSDSEVLPAVDGDAGAEPTLTWTGEDAPTNLTVKTLSAGDGAQVGATDMVTVAYAGWQWGKDETFDSSYSRGSDAQFELDGVITGWRCGLAGAHVGDRLELAIPADQAYGNDASSGAPTGPLVFVVEVKDALSQEEIVSGTKDATPQDPSALSDRGISVSGDLGAPATITVGDGATEPTEVETILVAKGTGEELTQDSTVLVHMAFSSWDGSESQSSWDMNLPQTISLANAPGLEGLVGLPVGSRVVVLLPSQDGPTQDGSSTAPIPAQAYVMDIERLAPQQ